MGTRSNVQFKKGADKVQFYLQWDGYPSYQLKNLNEFFKWNEGRMDDFMYSCANFPLWYSVDTALMLNDPKEKDSKTLEEVFKLGTKYGGMGTGIGILQPHDKIEEDAWIEWFYIVDFAKRHVEIYQPHELIRTVKFEDLKKASEEYEEEGNKVGCAL